MTDSKPAGDAEKLRLYLDQNVFSNIAKTDGDWRSNKYVEVLDEHAANAEVWLSPTHVVELTLCSDPELRRRLAEIMLALSDGRRMMRDYGTLVVHGFLAFVEKACPGAVSSRAYLNHYDETLKQIFLGSLALMATGHEPSAAVVESLTRVKLENRWLRAEAGKNPEAWVDAVKDCATHLKLSVADPRPELSAKSRDELVGEIREFEEEARRIGKAARQAVDKNRAQFVRAYAVGDVFQALGATFGQLPGDLFLTFNFTQLANEWAAVCENLSCKPLPSEPAPDHHALWMTEELVRALWRPKNGGVSASMLSQEALFRDYVDRLNESDKERAERLADEDGRLPTDSLTFDADHAALALSNMNVFVTRDRKSVV